MVNRTLIAILLLATCHAAQVTVQNLLQHSLHKSSNLLQIQDDSEDYMVCTCLPEADALIVADNEEAYESEEECEEDFTISIICMGDDCTVTDTSDTIDFEIDTDSVEQCLEEIKLDVVDDPVEEVVEDFLP